MNVIEMTIQNREDKIMQNVDHIANGTERQFLNICKKHQTILNTIYSV